MIDLRVYGEPGECTSAATEVEALARTVDEAGSGVLASRSRSASAWSGPAGDAFRDRCTGLADDLDELTSRLRRAARALEAFAGRLSAVRARLADVASLAAGAGLRVDREAVYPPDQPAGHVAPTVADAYATAVQTYNHAVALANEARQMEVTAHEELQAAMAEVGGLSFADQLLETLGVLPTGSAAMQTAAWAGNLALMAGGVGTSWMTFVKLGEFSPYIGRHAADPAGAVVRLGRAADHSSWRSLAGQAERRSFFEKAGVWGNRAGGVVTGALAGWQQWQADADNPAMDTGERVGRSVTEGAATGLGAWGGAVAGGEVGGAVGTFICPGAGTVVGGAIGGLVGGVAGSELGGMAGDALKDFGGEVGDAVGDAAGTVSDAAGAVGDAVTFWN